MNDRSISSPNSRNGSPRVAEQRPSVTISRLGKRVMVGIGIAGAIYIGNNVYNDAKQEATNHELAAQIVKAGPNAVNEVKNGTLSPTDFEVIKSPARGYIGAVAGVIGGNEHGASQNIQDVLSAQSPSGSIMKGQEIAVPVGFVDTEEQQELLASHRVVFPKP